MANAGLATEFSSGEVFALVTFYLWILSQFSYGDWTLLTLTNGNFHVVGTGQSQNIAFIGGAAAGGGLALIAIIALAVLAVKYRLARKFMNRNKVGDLYAAKDEQMSRRNAYIQEDDMIEKEDAF